MRTLPYYIRRLTRALPLAIGGAVLASASAMVCHVSPAQAQVFGEGAEVRAIEFQGLNRIDPQSARSRIYTQVDRPLDRSRLSEDIKRLFASNLFEDIQVAEQPLEDGGIKLIFLLIERPTVISIDYEVDGSAVSLEDLKKGVDLKPLEILDESRVQANVSKIKALYIEEGHFLVDVGYTIQRLPENQVKVLFTVKEGSEVQVRRIDVVGNRHLSSDEVEAIMATREGGWLSFLTSSGEFKRELFEQDLQRIQYFYLTKGFVQIQVGEPIVTLSSDRKSMDIVIPVEEGERFKVGQVKLDIPEEDRLVSDDTIFSSFNLKSGEWFDYSALQADASKLASVYRDRGFANANVSQDHGLDPENKTFSVTFKVQKGVPVHIRRIEIRGNKGTSDKVVRREMRIIEGDLYSSEQIRASRRRIMALGFFEQPTGGMDAGGVDIETRPTGDPGTVDLFVNLKERQVSSFQIGAGFSSYESFMFTGRISMENLLGRGQSITADVTLSGLRQLGTLRFFDPYFLDTDLTFSASLFNNNEVYTDFQRLRQGGSLGFGYRITDDVSLSFNYTLEHVNAELRRTTIEIEKLKQSGLTSSLEATLSYDTRDNRLMPTSGQFTSLTTEVASSAFGSENEFVRIVGRSRWYFPLFWDLNLRFNATVGLVEGLNGQTVPFFERFFVGGIYTLRGFERNSLGERIYTSASPDADFNTTTLGGLKQFIFNAEIEFPILKEMGIRGVVFFDAGNAWGAGNFNPFQLRTSAGLGFRWNSPMGPLRFEWGFPLAPHDDEDKSIFEFTIGNSF